MARTKKIARALYLYKSTHARPQRAAVLQLSVESEILVFQICKANGVPQQLKDFLKDTTIKFCGAAIDNDLRLCGVQVHRN
jgi:hypothetical protein